MKKQLFLGALFLFILTGIAGCKKDESGTTSFRKLVIGRWQVTKIEEYNSSTPTLVSTRVYATSDYMEFKSNDSDELDLSLTGSRVTGSFVLLEGSKLNITLPSELLYCTTNTINETNFQFTGTIDKSGGRVTRTYYLTR